MMLRNMIRPYGYKQTMIEMSAEIQVDPLKTSRTIKNCWWIAQTRDPLLMGTGRQVQNARKEKK